MPLRPLHRWKSFWFGVLLLAFLGWSWIRSMGQESVAGIGSQGVELATAHSNGRVFLICTMSGGDRWLNFGWRSVPAEPPQTWFPAAIEAHRSGAKNVDVSTSTTDAHGRHKKTIATAHSAARAYLGIAHWFLILLFLIPWTVFLLGRGRRMKRLAADPQA